MKKIIFCLGAFVTLQLNAQSFYKGALVTDVTWGFDIYSVKYHYGLKGNSSVIKDTSDAAASRGPGLGVEYGILNWLGVGVRGKYDTYYTSADKNTGITSRANGEEIGLILNFHPVHTTVFDLVGGFNIGYSHLRIQTNDINGTEIYGDGSWFDIHITPRFYFGRFGISTNISIPFINYPNMTTSSDKINSVIYSSWKGNGFGMNFGIQYRFLKNKSEKSK